MIRIILSIAPDEGKKYRERNTHVRSRYLMLLHNDLELKFELAHALFYSHFITTFLPLMM